MSWRKKLDPVLCEHFEDLVKDVAKEKKAYSSSQEPSKAQLWTAIAVLTKRVSDLELRLRKVEGKKKTKINTKVKKALKTL